MNSMTGFGRGEAANADFHINCEIKGVNHRYLDFNLRMSRRYNSLEDKIRDKIKQSVSRGRVEVSINVEKNETAGRNIKVDNKLAMIYHDSLIELAEYLKLNPEINVLDIFRLPEVFSLDDKEEDLEVIWGMMEEALEAALAGFLAMRSREGESLVGDIRVRNRLIVDTVDQIADRAPLVVAEHAERMKKRLADLELAGNIDEARMLHEIALFADRASIDEEMVRLKSHCGQLEDLLQAGEPNGRKCDFLVQEMFREVNTIASKGNDLQLGRIAVELKAELEKIREQIQNLE